ncbi:MULTISPECIES: substrate-binding domain-containing protein [unclassified Pseudoalteromonas]|jgi:ribose transport system substrate-binding protein|uniref:substrate-binding domain-containing protein n=1 Tax=unclassified Pseudoalteromonas TaxID=194690 RepID=UPI0025799390|nr:substrate-binding domain-containing protein [Pseudoalteromonas sp.]|tara:strand:+ start:2534 stop:3634 length:1101 start_codon:yes stop_codon:yes gene_type:complete
MSTTRKNKNHSALKSANIYFLSFLYILCTYSFSLSAQNIQAIDWSKAANSSDINLSAEQIDTIKEKKLTAALAWHGASPWINAVSRGAEDEFKKLGVRVIAQTDAQYDPAKQVADLENISALEPDLVLSLSIDGISTKLSYQKILAGGARLVLLSNPIPGFQHNKDFAGIVTDDMFGMGEAAATLVAQASNDTGKVGLIFHDANYFITNNRDQAFRKALTHFSNIKVISEKGFVKEHETSNIAAAMLLQHPEIDTIYVSWDTAAEGVIETLRSIGRKDIKVVTHDLGVNNLLDMAMNGNLYGTISDRPYDIGKTMARIAAGAEIGIQAPEFTLVPFDSVTHENIASIWHKAFKAPLPKLLDLALKQ